MRRETREQFNRMRTHLAGIYGVENVAEKFAVTQPLEQTLEDNITHSSDFLQRINVQLVTDQIGQKLGLGSAGPVASRTDTTSADRTPIPGHALDGDDYVCKQTNFDTYLKYSVMDAWARYADFQVRYRNHVLHQIALDRIMIGWNGTSAAATTNKGTNPLLQDVNIGWLQKARDNAPERVMVDGAVAGSVKIGATGDYKTVDELVYDLRTGLLDEWHIEHPDLVCVIGRDLIDDKYLALFSQMGTPTEAAAMNVILLNKQIGGLRAYTVPFFPAKGLIVTTFKNLSIYVQSGSRRRSIMDNPKRDQVDDFNSANEAYVVEDYGLFAAVEPDNVSLV